MSPKPKKANYGFLREAMMVKRYHTVGHLAEQETVGHHTANVIGILFFLFDDTPPIFMIRHALQHDAAELATGDIPATAKWAHPSLAKALREVEEGVFERQGLDTMELDEQMMALFKFADMMDLCFKGVEEMASGNDIFAPILARGVAYCSNLLETTLKDHRQANELWAVFHSNRFIDIKEFIVDYNPEKSTRH